MATVRHTVRIPEELDRRLREAAYGDPTTPDDDVTMNSIWTQALTEYLDNYPPSSPPPNANPIMAKVSFG